MRTFPFVWLIALALSLLISVFIGTILYRLELWIDKRQIMEERLSQKVFLNNAPSHFLRFKKMLEKKVKAQSVVDTHERIENRQRTGRQ